MVKTVRAAWTWGLRVMVPMWFSFQSFIRCWKARMVVHRLLAVIRILEQQQEGVIPGGLLVGTKSTYFSSMA